MSRVISDLRVGASQNAMRDMFIHDEEKEIKA